MKLKYIKIGCMRDKPADETVKCYKVVTKMVVDDEVINVYDSYRDMASSHEIKKYRQIYAGMSSDERQCITCDIDRPFTDVTVDEVKEACDRYQLPLPTNIVVNTRLVSTRPITDQYHYQIQWELDKPFYAKDWSIRDRRDCKEKNTYLTILESLASIFDGDRNYRGLWHKNAYCTDDIQRIPVTEEPAALDLFIDWYERNSLRATRSSSAGGYEKRKLEKGENTLSRNCFMLSKMPSKIYNYMNKHNQLPSLKLAMKWARDLERQSLEINKKGDIEPERCIRATVEGVLKSCKLSYDKSIMEKSNTRREFSRLIRCARKNINAVKTQEYLKQGKQKKDIAKLLDVNINTVTSYSKITTASMKTELAEFVDFYNKNSIEYYRELYNNVTTLLRSL